MKYFFLLCLYAWAFIPVGHAQPSTELIDPESINPTTRLLFYTMQPKNIKIHSYGGAHPSHFEFKLCKNCKPTIYKLKKGALLEYYGRGFEINALTQHFVDKDFSLVSVGIDRDKGEIIQLSLNPVNKEMLDIDSQGEQL